MNTMKSLRNRFERFCFRNQNKGIPNLMLYISLGTALVYLFAFASQNMVLYSYLCFNRELILQGQVWRLFTYPLTYGLGNNNFLLVAISLLCYYSLGRAMENAWGTCRFNLFYLCGVVMMDVYCMIFGGMADAYYLNLSLFLGYATLYPNAQFLLFFIIPVRAWIFALFDLVLVAMGLFFDPFPINLFSVISIANYFLFFGKDVLNVIPMSWRLKMRKGFRKKGTQKETAAPKTGTIPFPNGQTREAPKPRAPYTHRCTICGRTDITNPDLEFRYCSRCKGYYCYCQEHISNHTHIE